MRKFLYYLNGLGFLATFIILASLMMTSTIRPWVFGFITLNLVLYFDHVADLKRRLRAYEKNPYEFLFTVKYPGTYRVSTTLGSAPVEENKNGK